jgi:hypothetical protein
MDVAWLWTDTLAALLMEVDRLDPSEVAGLVRRPVAHRLPDDGNPLLLARRILHEAVPGSRQSELEGAAP